ncbi:MAG: tetratricopeptide repeat protein [Deltaproteobacteria bacterium]|nr:tetratricopeptide repeat protein [Deltaproteobacteria bacterium]
MTVGEELLFQEEPDAVVVVHHQNTRHHAQLLPSSPLNGGQDRRNGRFATGCRLCQLFGGLLAACLLVACAANQEAARRDAQTAYKLGIAYLAEGRPSPALQELSKAETLSPQDPEILNALGFAYWIRKEYGLAEEKFRKAVALKRDYSEAWNNLSAMFIDQGRPEQAIQPAEEALKNLHYGTQEKALSNLGWALYKTGRADEGERRLRQAVETAPSYFLPRRMLATLLADRGEHAKALEQFDAALRLGGDDPDLYVRKGISLWKLGERKPARDAFEKALQLAPGSEAGRAAKTYLDLLQ